MGSKSRLILKVFLIIFSVVIVLLAAIYIIVDPFSGGKPLPGPETAEDSIRYQREKDSMYVAAFVEDNPEQDSIEEINVSEPVNKNIPYEVDHEAGKSYKAVYRGRRINIAVTGLDSRLGTRSNHADANHIVSVLLDSGKIEIISVPRDTRADAGYEETEENPHPQNKITIVRARRGRQAYLQELAKIARLDKIHYWVEVGFSQVIGILELLGYDDSGSTLQMLRSRKALGGDDYQRVYNQAQFIRQMLLRYFFKMTGLSGEILIRGGLAIVDSNIDTETAKEIVAALEEKNFPQDHKDVGIKIRPPINIAYKQYDFTNDSVVIALKSKIEGFNERKDIKSKKLPEVGEVLTKAIDKAVADSAKSPSAVIRKLSVYFDQRAWFQVKDKRQRSRLRDQMAILLIDAYKKKNEFEKAQEVERIVLDEKELFNKELFQ